MELGVGKPNSSNPWLHAWFDPLAGLKTVTSCVRLADLNGDGHFKLCVCDFDKKLKVFKGTSLIVEYALLDVPVALCVVYTELSSPRMPSIAVAAGSHVFIYRQLRPYRKWSCPIVEIAQAEQDVWNDLKHDNIDDVAAVKLLVALRDRGTSLSSRSTELLSYGDDTAGRWIFINEMKNVQYFQQTLITVMEAMKKESEDIDAINLLVIGTEAGQVLILPQDPNNSAYLCKVSLPSTPVLMSVAGVFDIEWRVSVACRDGKLYSLKSGDARGTAVLVGGAVDLGAQAVAMARQEKLLWVALMDKTIACYTFRGKRTKIIMMPDEITEMCVVPVKRSKVSHLLLVALSSGEVRMFKDGQLVYTFELEKPIIAMRFGSYGREDSSLVCVHGHGSLTVKIWRRAVDADSLLADAGPPPEQDIPLPVPKKTKLYVEQTQRERENASEIHRAFQRDLCKLRLETAKAYVKTLTDGTMGTSSVTGPNDLLRVQVLVTGLGPKFVLKILLQNNGSYPLVQTRMFFSFDSELYVMGHSFASNPCICIPVILPGPKHVIDAEIMSTDPAGRSGQIMLLLYSASNTSSLPILTISVRMPVSELLSI